MTSVEKAVEIITAQQTEQNALGPVWCVGEQLKDMLQNDEDAAALVVKDLEQDSMGIAECEKKIHDFARDNGGFCGPKDADRIIRKFYGIENTHSPAPAEPAAARRKKISVTDFL